MTKKLEDMSVDELVRYHWNLAPEAKIDMREVDLDYLNELIRRAKIAESKAAVIEELKSLNVRFLDRYCEDLPHKENCEEEIFSANDFFNFINKRIAELKGANNGE